MLPTLLVVPPTVAGLRRVRGILAVVWGIIGCVGIGASRGPCALD